MYMLWFNFILGLSFITLLGVGGRGWQGVWAVMYDNEYNNKQKEVKFKPRIKLNHIICIMYAVKLRKQWKDGKSCSLRICCLGPTRKSSLFGINLLFAICTSHQNTPCPSNFCITVVFDFPWVFQWFQKKLKRMLMQNFWGQTRCIMGGVQMVN